MCLRHARAGCRLASALALVSMVPGGTVCAQELPVFEGRADVDVVNIDVFVHDREGRAVTGLEAADFVVHEDGRPVEISNFSAIEARPSSAPGPAESGERRPEASQAPEPWFVAVVIDELHSCPENRNEVLRRLEEFVPELSAQGHHVMLASLDSSLKILYRFGDPPEDVAPAFQALRERGVTAAIQSATTRYLGEQVNGGLGGGGKFYHHDPAPAIRTLRAFVSNAASSTVEALDGLVCALSVLDGRKAVLFVSDGMTLEESRRRAFDEMTSRANSYGVTFYPVDSRGVTGSVLPSSVHNQLAEATGGQVVTATNRYVSDLERVAEDFESYYSIGYVSPAPGTGRDRRIEVDTRDGRLEVRHRRTFRSLDPAARQADRTRGALRLGMAGANDVLGLRIQPGPYRKAGRNVRIPVELLIPLDRIVLEPRGKGMAGRVQVTTAASDEDGKMSQVQSKPLTIRIDELELPPGAYFTYAITMVLRPGAHDVVFGVHDEIADTDLFITRAIEANPGTD